MKIKSTENQDVSSDMAKIAHSKLNRLLKLSEK